MIVVDWFHNGGEVSLSVVGDIGRVRQVAVRPVLVRGYCVAGLINHVNLTNEGEMREVY